MTRAKLAQLTIADEKEEGTQGIDAEGSEKTNATRSSVVP